MPRRHRHSSALFGLIAIVMLLVQALPAYAWKPYTHNVTAQSALEDAADGKVTINGREYTLRPDVAQALAAWPAYYNAGVIGPDGYPDLTFGQSVIHPEETGRWLREIYEQAWAAQTDPSYSAAQRQQILAFAYGYLTHGAGDMWAHTLVNAYAEGVFPAVKEILSEQEKLEIALRHLIVEGYIGDATPGFDGNPNRTVTPYINKETGQPDISDDSTPGRAFAVPTKFLYETLVNPNHPTPVNVCGNGVDEDRDGIADDGCPGGPGAHNPSGGHADGFSDGTHGSPVDGAEVKRGPLIDFFTVYKAKLQLAKAEYEADRDHVDCLILDKDCWNLPDDRAKCIAADADCANEPISVEVNTVRGKMRYTYDRNVCYGGLTGVCAPDPADAVDSGVNAIIVAYLDAWIDDIDDGLEHWPEVGQALTEALFDPQARRDAQNFECRNFGPDTTADADDNIRSKCEEGITVIDTVMYKLDPYITNHLLSMLGLPDVTGAALEALNTISELLDDVIGPAGNPLRMAKQELREFAKKLIYQEINDRYGIDVEAAQPFFMHPSTWFTSNAPITIKAKPVLDANGVPVWEKNADGEWRPKLETITLDLFTNDQHQRVDALLGLPANHHVPMTDGPQPPSETFPNGLPQATRLADNAEADPTQVAPMRNTTMMAKLLMLDGAELNRALGDQLVADGYLQQAAAVTTYSGAANAHANIMLDGFTPGAAQATTASRQTTWLKSIDSDHAWRRDGLPVFCDAVPNTATADPSDMMCAVSAPNAIRPDGQPTLRAPLHGEYENGGHGNFPVWESCLLRPAFRGLFRDWENGGQQFPDHGDLPSPDAADPNAPTSALAVGGNVKTVGSTTFLSGNHSFTVSATDSVFAPTQLGVRYRFYRDGQQPAVWQPLANNGTFAIPAGAGDGLWRVEYQSADPCHPFEGVDAMAPEPVHGATFYLDTTPPKVTFTTPSQDAVYLLNETKPASYSCSDGTGSGVTTCVGTVAVGAPISTAPVGVKSFTVTTADLLGNAASPTVSYKVTYKLNVLYDQTKSHKAGSVVPIKLQLVDANNVNQSAATIVVNATGLTKTDNSASTSVVDDAGNANPDSNFRFEPGAAAYIFNLKTKGLTTGTWALSFTAAGDPVPHTVTFDIR